MYGLVSKRFLVLLMCGALVGCGVPRLPAPTMTTVTAAPPAALAASATIVPPTVAPTATPEPPTATSEPPTATPEPATATVSPSTTATRTATATVAPTEAANTTATVEATSTHEFAYIDGEGHLRIHALSGEDMLVWDRGMVEQVAWSPDGARIAFIVDATLHLWQRADASVREVARDVRETDAPSWSADGLTIAFTRGTSDSDSRIVVLNVADGKERDLAAGSNPRFAPAGDALIAAGPAETILGMHEGPWTAPVLWPTLDTQPITATTAENLMDWSRLAWSEDGSLAAISNVLIDRTGQIIGQPGTPGVEAPDQGTTVHEILNGMSPEARQVAVASLTITRTGDADRNRTDLTLFDRGTAERRTLLRGDEDSGHGMFWRVSRVNWSPDGRTIAFVGSGTSIDGTQGSGVWIGESAGTSLRLLSQTTEASQQAQSAYRSPQFSPDGRFLLWEQRGDAVEVWTWELGSGDTPQRQVVGRGVSWRP